MYSRADVNTQAYIEAIQKNSYEALGVESSQIDEMLKSNVVNKRVNGVYEQPDLDNLRADYEKANEMGFFYEFPEHHYDTSFEYMKFAHSAATTKYDSPFFLHRFSNILNLCHEAFTQDTGIKRKNIILSSLPFFNMNGVCLKHSENTNIIFMNQGVLAIVPKIYRYLMPLIDVSLFGHGKKNGNLQEVVNFLIGSHHFKSSFQDLMRNKEFSQPHAGEKWYYAEMLKQSAFSKHDQLLNKSSRLARNQNPNSIPYSQAMGRYYANRGAFIFLMGHEFAHAYNEHCDIKSNQSDLNLRPDNFVNSFDDATKKQLQRFSDLSPYNVNFCLHQALEEEADAHGLLCVLKYCIDNNLDDQRSMCVFAGAIGTFVLMEIQEYLNLLTSMGDASTKEYLGILPMVRNMLFREEHPTPVTRLTMAIHHEVFANSPVKGTLINLNEQLVSLCENICAIMMNDSKEMCRLLTSSELLNSDIHSIFSVENSLGAIDLRGGNYAKIRNSLAKKQKTAEIINLFGKR